MDKFKSAAKYYNRYRPQYPKQLFQLLSEECELDGSGRLLDVGCGTGFLTIPLSKYFDEAIGLDLSQEMLNEAKLAAEQKNCTNIKWIQGNAEHLGSNLGEFKMITAGRSLHWMDTTTILPQIYERLLPGGYVALVGEQNGFWLGQEDWCKAVAKLIVEFTGNDFSANKKPLVLWQDMLANFPYQYIKPQIIHLTRTWNIDNIIGFLLSTSFCSTDVLGSRYEEFKQRLNDSLLKINAKNEFVEKNTLSVVIAKK